MPPYKNWMSHDAASGVRSYLLPADHARLMMALGPRHGGGAHARAALRELGPAGMIRVLAWVKPREIGDVLGLLGATTQSERTVRRAAALISAAADPFQVPLLVALAFFDGLSSNVARAAKPLLNPVDRHDLHRMGQVALWQQRPNALSALMAASGQSPQTLEGLWLMLKAERAPGLLPHESQATPAASVAPGGRSNLHLAAMGRSTRGVSALLRRPAEAAHLNRMDESGATPLYLAVDCGHIGLASMLLGAGAWPEAAGPAGRTALHAAAAGGSEDAARMLMQHGARADVPDSAGIRPLSLACQRGDAEVARALLEGGARARTAPAEAMGPWEHALLANNRRCIEVLREYRAAPSPRYVAAPVASAASAAPNLAA